LVGFSFPDVNRLTRLSLRPGCLWTAITSNSIWRRRGPMRPVNAGKPTVHYRLLEESGTSGPDQRSFLFELTISFTDAQVTRMALVTLQQNGAGAWQVANFEELP
jgi:hypothetical protein